MRGPLTSGSAAAVGQLSALQLQLDALLAEREGWTRDTDGLKDTIRIKDKILQDQQDSIDKLKQSYYNNV